VHPGFELCGDANDGLEDSQIGKQMILTVTH
jgi:hypothetical protein